MLLRAQAFLEDALRQLRQELQYAVSVVNLLVYLLLLQVLKVLDSALEAK